MIIVPRVDKRKNVKHVNPWQPFPKRLQELERHELQEVRNGDRDSIASKETEAEPTEDHDYISVRSNIPAREFPDYVLEITKETTENKSKLATEYQVSVYEVVKKI